MGVASKMPRGRCDTAKKRLADARLGFRSCRIFHRITNGSESVTIEFLQFLQPRNSRRHHCRAEPKRYGQFPYVQEGCNDIQR